MKLIFEQNKCGLTRPDVLVAVLVAILFLTMVFALVLPVNEPNRRRAAERALCINNLKQISMAFRIWEEDNGSMTNALVAAIKTNADTVGLNSGQIAWINMMRPSSNVLSSLKILHCPADHETPITTNAAGLKIRISYFLNLDASEEYPQQLLSGDDNLVLGKPGEREPVEGFAGPAVKPGILLLSSNTPFSWTRERHHGIGNISLADGSVMEESPAGLQNAAKYSLGGTPISTNRIAIP